MSADQMLARASVVIGERRQAYGDPKVVMAAIAARWSITLGHAINRQRAYLDTKNVNAL